MAKYCDTDEILHDHVVLIQISTTYVNMKHVASSGVTAYFSLPSVKHKYIFSTDFSADER